jgi:hypothetical protein
MKIKIFSILLLSSLLISQESGFMRIEKRLTLSSDSLHLSDFYNEFFIEIGRMLDEDIYLRTSIDIRFYTFPDMGNLKDLTKSMKNFPLDIFLWEAFLEIKDFPFRNVDIRIGKQRVAWGTADGFNPTDNLNPDDFSDILRFTRKLPTEAFLFTYYTNGFSLSGYWSPSVHPALIPPDLPISTLSEPVELPLSIAEVRDSLILPRSNLKNTQFALKLSNKFGRYDVSLSGFYGYEHFPLPQTIILHPISQKKFLSETFLTLPRIIVLGADFAGGIGDFGIWGEIGMFIPEKIETELITPFSRKTLPVLSRDTYWKWTFGFDIFFQNDTYLNFQIIRGFPTEIGRDKIGNYFALFLRRSFRMDELSFKLYGMLEIRDFKKIEATFGQLLSFEISYLPRENLEITLGAFIIDGSAEATFGRWKDLDLGFVRALINF